MSAERVIEISLTPVPFRFPRVIGANAYAEMHGAGRNEWLVRARTNAGNEGLSNAARFFRRDDATVEGLLALLREVVLGRSVDEFLELDGDRVRDAAPAVREALRRDGWLSTLAFDLVGRARGVSAVELLGGRRRDRIDVYDTTLYFDDLLHPERGVQRLADEARDGLQAGYRQFKVKVGRGGRWMAPQAGLRRDIDVVLAVREAVGPAAALMVDANFGYDGRLDLLADFIRETAAAKLFWLEEMIPAELVGYRRLRELQAEHCPDALLTAGEVDRDPPSGVFPALVEEGLIDGYQPDILGVGLLRWNELDAWLEARGVSSIPHSFHNGNFGRQVGLVFGAASRVWVTLEDERPQPNIYGPDGPTLEAGSYPVPEGPGLGLLVEEEVYRRDYAANAAVIAL
jgi:L-alanine-DL-glutamate epimerase-like enolase superfamily enzyme